jgi:hypothetical protein
MVRKTIFKEICEMAVLLQGMLSVLAAVSRMEVFRSRSLRLEGKLEW